MERTFRVMIVEDSETQALKLRLLLEEEHCEVLTVATAECALAELNQSLPDLIVVDYYLPAMRGDDLCRRIRMNLNTRSIPILMLTAADAGAAEMHGLESGADDYVSKSENSDILLLRIHALLRKVGAQGVILNRRDSDFQRARLLAIDDSPTHLEFLATELRSQGYDVEKAASGPEALSRLASESFDCVLVDLLMPEMDGIEVCRRITGMRRALEASVAVIILTSCESKDDITRGLEAGADDFVSKSSDLDVLRARIQALLRRKFFQEENRRIVEELAAKEMEILRAHAGREAAEVRAAMAEELREKNIELERASTARDFFMCSMSHELRTPLNAVIGFTGMLLMRLAGPLTPDQEKHLTTVQANGKHLLSLVNDLLDLAKLKSGKVEVQLQVVSSQDVLAQVVSALRTLADAKSIVFEASFPALPLMVKTDPRALSQIVLNLGSNAIKFTPKGSVRLELAESLSDGLPVAVVHVRDTGIGIKTADQERLFRAFERIDPQPGMDGAGLGLHLCWKLAELIGGRIEFESEFGQGSRFTVLIPKVELLRSSELAPV